MEIVVLLGENTQAREQYVVGGYYFHDSRVEGTKNPSSVCDVMFYGATHPPQGELHPPSTPLLWSVAGTLHCSYLLVPAVGQALVLMIRERASSPAPPSPLVPCSTRCGREGTGDGVEGCRCELNGHVTLQEVDHLLFVHATSRTVIACVCGDWQPRTQLLVEAQEGAVDVIYHVAHYIWSTPTLDFNLHYQFAPASVCGPSYRTETAGELGPRQVMETNKNQRTYLYADCVWVISSQSAAALALTITPPIAGSCSIWNLTVQSSGRATPRPPLTSVTCAGEDTTLVHVPTQHAAATLTLQLRGMERSDWLISWNSHWPPLPPSPSASPSTTTTTTTATTTTTTTTTTVSPKPELSRTVNVHPTRKTYLVHSGSGSLHCGRLLVLLLQLLLQLLLLLLLLPPPPPPLPLILLPLFVITTACVSS
ncbi:uncharacterized protein LOC123512124 isoform X1 [Portunus trituberculatus]|uniref:uncharacterized protein LOC123512124 isoform X1 n=1 Tax=Portunus trituberculatus TaxID=210409 RepID=UPI001E1CB81F|nr:uncharacterized protein LOC123512124 isoform X1 [Portunus trituberculatus]XP_045124385.1 uncharacterized protein LOC123512124 isoform X1 [Portunus trituberculatus]XP_045124466.1 uncharacterized protein LOC123512124 isoform X1 [Portunus trituberculatus]